GTALPLFQGDALAHVFVDPGDQVARERDAVELPHRQCPVGLLGEHLAVYVEDSGCRVIQQGLHLGVDETELHEQLAHMLRAAPRSRLVGHAGHPLDEVLLEKPVHAHQHAAHRAISTDIIFYSLRQRLLDDRHVDRVEHDDGIIVHSQGLRGVYPIAVPAGSAQLRVDLGGVITALAGHEDVHCRQHLEVESVGDRWRFLADLRPAAAALGRRKEERLDEIEIALGAHAIDQHRTDHAAPAYDSDFLHGIRFKSTAYILPAAS